MAGLSFDLVHDYLQDQGGRIEYHQLIKHFKSYLSDPNNQESRVKFKDYVNKLATVQQDGKTKFLILRPEFKLNYAQVPDDLGFHPQSSIKTTVNNSQLSPNCPPIPENSIPEYQHHWRPFVPGHHGVPSPEYNYKTVPNEFQNRSNSRPLVADYGLPENYNLRTQPTNYYQQQLQPQNQIQLSNYPDTFVPPPLLQQPIINKSPPVISQSSNHNKATTSPGPVIYRRQSLNDDQLGIFCPPTLPGQDTPPPQPPPRRKSSGSIGKADVGKLRNSTGLEDEAHKCKQQGESVDPNPLKEIQELTQTPGRVKERAQKLNKMASEGEILAPPMPANNLPGHRSRGKENRETDDGDSGSLHPLDPLRRRWMITASNCDYSGLIQLLKEDNKLASFKDFTSGYTALHWAAKFGSLEIIKLIAGTCGVDPDIKTHSGYTPLHVAAIHGHERIMQLLTITYGANANIRDYSGRLAHQYLKRPEPLTNSSKSVKNSGGRSNKMTSGSLNNGSHRKSGRRNSIKFESSYNSYPKKSSKAKNSLASYSFSTPLSRRESNTRMGQGSGHGHRGRINSLFRSLPRTQRRQNNRQL